MSNSKIQIIEKQPIIVRIQNKYFEFVKPYFMLNIDNFEIHKTVLKGSQLAWNISGVQLTYNKLKTLINLHHDKTKNTF